MQTASAGGGKTGGVGPLSTMLVMDVSGSMDKNGKIDGAKAAAKAYVDQMRPGDQAGVMVYNTKANYIQPLTTDHAALTSAIDGIKTGGDTAMYDALIAAEEALKSVSGRKAIIAVTDVSFFVRLFSTNLFLVATKSRQSVFRPSRSLVNQSWNAP